jgi:hypothetical protein
MAAGTKQIRGTSLPRKNPSGPIRASRRAGGPSHTLHVPSRFRRDATRDSPTGPAVRAGARRPLQDGTAASANARPPFRMGHSGQILPALHIAIFPAQARATTHPAGTRSLLIWFASRHRTRVGRGALGTMIASSQGSGRLSRRRGASATSRIRERHSELPALRTW